MRHGDEHHPQKSAVIISIGNMATIRMFVGLEEAGKVYADYTGNNDNNISIDEEGYGAFEVGPGSLSVWIENGREF